MLPGGTVYERIAGLRAGGEQLHSAFAALPGKLNGFLAATAEDARGRFGCCGYAGAADTGGLGWAILDTSAEPPVLDGDYVRDEHEQVTYLRELVPGRPGSGYQGPGWEPKRAFGALALAG